MQWLQSNTLKLNVLEKFFLFSSYPFFDLQIRRWA